MPEPNALTRIGLLVVFAAILITACGTPKARQAKPKVLISQNTLTQVLTDVHLVEAAMNMRRNNGQEFESQKNAIFDSVFVHYSITPQILEDNLLYYNQQPQIMEKVYQDVIDSLMSLQKNLRLDDGMPR
ncbi:MAG: DUF4296 domain-containing protein [Bacteroidia bacterium]|nr:DUF4296 domain-containing protein [Bacteroidia bacterium]